MVISYDNLITRLWISGAILPFDERDDLLIEDSTNDSSNNNNNDNLDTEQEAAEASEKPVRKGINRIDAKNRTRVQIT